jgi:transcriptional regulator with XRE-family HTH domain
MLRDNGSQENGLTGHALRNAHLRLRSLERARTAPPLARTIVQIRAQALAMTRLELARRSGISRGTLRDIELGIHTPTRNTLQRLLTFCQARGIGPEQLEELRGLYAGPGDTLERLIARLELRAGSSRALAERVGISPTTLWEYRRGSFPVPLAVLRQLCRAVAEDPARAELLWHQAERRRLVERGYPEALAEFWVLCARQGLAEKHLLARGLSTAVVRRLRYLELPPWSDVEDVARALCPAGDEYVALQKLWARNQNEQHERGNDGFGPRLQRLRQQQGVSRRELADLFGIGGKKPARIIKHVEEDGFFSAQAFPAGLATLLTSKPTEHKRLLEMWQERRRQFHRRHRPEMHIDMRLTRELYGLELKDMEAVLGYSSLEYQRIERGVTPLPETAQARIVQAIHQAGQQRIAELLERRQARDAGRLAWQAPPSVVDLINLLAGREGGLIPLARLLRKAGVRGCWAGRLRGIAQGIEIPAWPVLAHLGKVARVGDLTAVHWDWEKRYRERLQARCRSPLGVELRLLIAEVSPTLRAFSRKLGFNFSVLSRDLARINRDAPLKWFHVERILRAVGIPVDDKRWQEVHALWYTSAERHKGNGNGFTRRQLI